MRAARASIAALLHVAAAAAAQPHIVVLLADDLGWAGVSWNNPEVQTPHLEELRAGGVALERHYTYRFCSPTRSALLTGRLAPHVNQMNHNNDEPGGGMHVNFTTIADVLRGAGYETLHAGKWHLGMAHAAMLPAARGFDASLAYLSGAEDHWTQIRSECLAAPDLWDTLAPAVGRNGTAYGDELYAARVVDAIVANGGARPLFVYYAMQVAHAPNEAPDVDLALYDGICDDDSGGGGAARVGAAQCSTRQQYEAMATFVDRAARNVTAALNASGMWASTLLLFTPDNGGPSGTDSDSANNYPLRGGKYSDFDGGIRTAAFVAGGALPPGARGRVLGSARAHVISIADWYRTFATLAGVADPTDAAAAAAGLPPLDSIDQWPLLSGQADAGARAELLLTTGGIAGSGGGLLNGSLKILFGNQKPAIFPGPNYPNGSAPAPLTVDCGQWDVAGSGCLFDLDADPTEHDDLAGDAAYDAAREALRARYAALRAGTYQTPASTVNCSVVEAAVYGRWSGFWGPYLEELPYNVTYA